MNWKSLWTGRRRLMFMMELVVLPATGLIVFSLYHLHSLQRDRAVEAAIQRDFQHVLKISEKRMNGQLNDMIDDVRQEFPKKGETCSVALDRILAEHPYAAHVFVYDKEKGIVFRSQPKRMNEMDFRTESDKFLTMIAAWFPLEGESIAKVLHGLIAKGEIPHKFFTNEVPRGKAEGYQTVALFPLGGSDPGRVAFGGIAFDSEYLRNGFFPQQLEALLKEGSSDAQHEVDAKNHPVFRITWGKDNQPLAISPDWDGGEPEVERKLDGPLGDVNLGVKYKGTTVAAMSQRFLRTSFLVLAAISVLLLGGILSMYRNVSREMELAKLKADFVSNVSHELRTPLSLIRLYAETLELGRLPNVDKQRGYHRIIREESERLTALINNVLDFSRIEAGRKEYDFQATDLRELVRETLESYRYQIEQQGFTFEEKIAEDLPKVRVDRESIARSLLNLVNNSIKYSSDEKYLRVNLYGDNGLVRLEVIDRGIGIPHAEQHRIFEKFYRVGDPLVHNTKGSGLGLSLVRTIVHAHGGDVWVESNQGRGSKFTVVLPVDQISSSPRETHTAKAS
jgi:signal transduction histidine kinase